MAKVKRSGEHFEEGKYREADKMVSDLRGKYGLKTGNLLSILFICILNSAKNYNEANDFRLNLP